MSASQLTIRDSDSNAEYVVDYLDPSSRATTYRDLLSVLSRLHSLSIPYPQLFYVDDDTGAHVLLQETDPITPAHPSLLVSPLRYELRLFHYGAAYPSLDTPAVAEATSTVGALKAQLSREMDVPCSVVTLDGRILSDDSRLVDLGLSPSSPTSLYGQLRVVLVDVETERQTSLDGLHAAMTVHDLKLNYASKEKRVNVERADISHRSDDDDSDRPLADDVTLHAAGIQHGALLHVKTPPYVITIREGTASHDVTVFDHYTPHQLKEEYNKLTTNPLTSGDSLVYNDEQIADATELYKLRMKERGVVYVTREDMSLQRFDYLCADCGNDVKLKKTDAVRCRECGHRILFKRRTTKPCQYLCR